MQQLPQCSSRLFAPAAGSLVELKDSLRRNVKQRLRQMSPEQRAAEDAAIQRHVLQSDWFTSSRHVCAYISCSKLREVATDGIVESMLAKGDDVSLYVPRVMDRASNMRMLRITALDDDNVDRESTMGIVEPKLLMPSGDPREDVMESSHPLDLILLPGLAFDLQGGRLGRGGGYYDAFLTAYLKRASQQSWCRPTLAALAYSPQVLSEPLPMDDSDVYVDLLVTSQGVRRVGSASSTTA